MQQQLLINDILELMLGAGVNEVAEKQKSISISVWEKKSISTLFVINTVVNIVGNMTVVFQCLSFCLQCQISPVQEVSSPQGAEHKHSLTLATKC